jgi:hypothetical protein
LDDRRSVTQVVVLEYSSGFAPSPIASLPLPLIVL